MVTTCVAVGCQNREDRDPGKSFYRFPTDPESRSRWIAAVKREGWQPTSASRVCSDFILSKSDNPLSPDYVPSQFQYVASPQKKKSKVALETFNRRSAFKKRRRCVVYQSETDQSLPSMSASAPAEYCVEAADEQKGGPQIPDIARETSIQTDLSMTDIEALQSVSN
ncbi:THAP domain-containing protein 1-like [Tachypleus tridentatus]|uniref:THAP domain-containing protein 1-like n=1 Tax=Tachypleus tridentatus TaxID=6853 RepID=UPI003FCF74A9